ncbi:iron chelate uptake ABC transporter family permease subunit [Paraphotobacterium marinum]
MVITDFLKKNITIVLSLMLVTISIFFLVQNLSISEILKNNNSIDFKIFEDLRLPRLFACILIGSALSLSGAILQVILSNPLAEPGIMGISGGASVGVALVYCFLSIEPSILNIMCFAMVGSLIFTIILVVLSVKFYFSATKLLLAGLSLGLFSSVIVTWSYYFSTALNMKLLMYWLMGSLSGISWIHVYVLTLTLPIMIWLYFKSNVLDLIMLGDLHAKQLGINIERFRIILIVVLSIVIGLCVSCSGIISFLGLIVPHCMRLLLGSSNKPILLNSAITGAILLLISDILSRSLISYTEIPVGIIITTLSVPIFIYLLIRFNHE